MSLKRNIPISFKLFATKISVVFDDSHLIEKNALGESSFSESKIRLATKTWRNDLPDEVILDSFYHEKVHMILDTMGRDELSKDEEFVEVFSRLLRQADETEEFETK